MGEELEGNRGSNKAVVLEMMVLIRGWLPFSCLIASSTIRLRPLGLFLPPGNHLLILFMVFLFFLSLQVSSVIFLGSLLSSILCICSLQFILYCVNLSKVLKTPNFSYLAISFFFFQKCIYLLYFLWQCNYQMLNNR